MSELVRGGEDLLPALDDNQLHPFPISTRTQQHPAIQKTCRQTAYGPAGSIIAAFLLAALSFEIGARCVGPSQRLRRLDNRGPNALLAAPPSRGPA